MLALFYAEGERLGLSDSKVLRNSKGIVDLISAATDAAFTGFKPRGLSSIEIEEAKVFLKVIYILKDTYAVLETHIDLAITWIGCQRVL